MKTLVWIGLALFLVSLFLPSMRGGDVVLKPEIRGWTLATASLAMILESGADVVASIYVFSMGLGNFLILASPYLYFRLLRKSSAWIPLAMIVATLDSISFFFVEGRESLLIGYYVWVLSYVSVTTSIVLLFFQLKPKPEATTA